MKALDKLDASISGAHEGVEQALQSARAAMRAGDRLLVAGSFLTVTAALEVLNQGH